MCVICSHALQASSAVSPTYCSMQIQSQRQRQHNLQHRLYRNQSRSHRDGNCPAIHECTILLLVYEYEYSLSVDTKQSSTTTQATLTTLGEKAGSLVRTEYGRAYFRDILQATIMIIKLINSMCCNLYTQFYCYCMQIFAVTLSSAGHNLVPVRFFPLLLLANN